MERMRAQYFADIDEPLAEDIKKYMWLNEKGFVTDEDLLLMASALCFKHKHAFAKVKKLTKRSSYLVIEYVFPVEEM